MYCAVDTCDINCFDNKCIIVDMFCSQNHTACNIQGLPTNVGICLGVCVGVVVVGFTLNERVGESAGRQVGILVGIVVVG
jgi:hypothetical protein